MAEYIDWYDSDAISDLLVGRKVVVAENDTLTLDNGVKVRVSGLSACCAWYDVTSLSTVDNVITSAQVVVDPDPEADDKVFRIFVFADNEKINLATLEGSDGSGYYGTGFTLEVDRIWEVCGMGFFKKRGKPRQYRITYRPNTVSGSMLYELEVWNRCSSFWEHVRLYGEFRYNALGRLREEAALDAKIKGYGDNYEITELF